MKKGFGAGGVYNDQLNQKAYSKSILILLDVDSYPVHESLKSITPSHI